VKCIYCDHDTNYKDRQAMGGCARCRKPFAFEPRTGSRITDLGFKRAVDAVSADGHVKWGLEHLYYEVWRRLDRPQTSIPFGFVVFVSVVALIVTIVAWGSVKVVAVALAVGTGVASLYVWQRYFRRRQARPLPREEFDRMWASWQRTHPDHHPGVIIRRAPVTRPRPLAADVPLYSFDHAVVCDRARTVDLLLANNFHFENNCAVLSIDGYPPGPFETVRAMLKRNPRLHVFALHDATPNGCRLAHRLVTEAEWFKGQRVVDVGLRPSHGRALSRSLFPAPGTPVALGQGITGDEALWLSHFTLEVAAIRPEQVLKRLFRAMRRTPEPDSRGADGAGDSSGVASGGDAAAPDASAASEGAFGGAGASGGWDSAAAGAVVVDSDSFSGIAGDMDGDGGDGDGSG
jgi:uncharacterized membrane protein YgcG